MSTAASSRGEDHASNDFQDLLADLLDGHGRPAARSARALIEHTGSQVSVTVDPQTIFRPALWLRASGLVIAHNHLAADPVSGQDRAVTRRLSAAGVLLGVPLQAHLVLRADGRSDCCDSRGGWTPYASGTAA